MRPREDAAPRVSADETPVVCPTCGHPCEECGEIGGCFRTCSKYVKPVGTTPTPEEEHVWSCSVGGVVGALPDGVDLPMRQAIQRAFYEITGTHAEYCFSGWGGTLEASLLAAE